MVSLDCIRAPLFVPADRPDRFAKAAASGADAVILDLEDAVGPNAKSKARTALDVTFTNLPIIVRVNDVTTQWHFDDIAALRELPLAAVMLPKTETVESLSTLSQGLPNVPIWALIETAQGLANTRAIAAAPPVTRLVFGSVDYCADLGCDHLREVLLPARCALVLASRLDGRAAPIDGVTTRLDDPNLTHNDALHARALGMAGKLCIHPKQVVEVKRAFAPNEAEIDWARRVLASGDGAVSVDGAMVDAPVRLRARAILNMGNS